MKSCAVLAVVALATLTGCVSYYTETETQALVNPAAGTNPVYRTEWDIKTNKVSADGSARILFWIFTSGEPKYADIPCHSGFFPTDRAVYKAKAAATYTACTNSKSDALLGAIYNYKITNYFFTSTVECSVRGFPATVSGIKLIEDKPILIDKDSQIVRVKQDETVIDYTGKTRISGGAVPGAKRHVWDWFMPWRW